ncbi:phosphatase PAP2 family protein [Ferruginibacter sp. SUN002]|uniref:phosphatase PAP2 family protein n=1 Tax=Ferruginibacter sp. SUN002 TaxID=2937789 RepID=UPI003D36A6FE
MNLRIGLMIFGPFFFSVNIKAQNLDVDILKTINKKETTFKNKYLELCASSVTVMSVGTPVTTLAIGLIRHDKKLQKDALYMFGGYLTSAIITQGTKKVLDRNRPFEEYSFIIKRDDESGGMSFPSGHTSAAFNTAASLCFRYPEWYVIAPSCLYAVSVGWARMYQGVHYPSDVLAGALVGAGSAFLSYKIQKWHDRKVAKRNKSSHQTVSL